MASGDPGSCLYGFDGRGVVQSEEHRAACIAYLETEGRKAADVNVAAGDDPEGQHPELDALVAYLKAAPVEGWSGELDEFTEAYVRAALWSTTGDGGEALDDDYGAEHLAPETLERMKADCARFREVYGPLVIEANYDAGGEGSVESHAGHDFWLTRAGHGVGFWDGDWTAEAGEILTMAAKSFGDYELYVGDDGRIHGSGGRIDPDPVEGAPRVAAPGM